ncbi:MAG: hypothetical protein QOI91_2246 [Solirubrobacteraceae bacterium]|nr:hypothetical protein [Solirubrobacteraceae bacterium]
MSVEGVVHKLRVEPDRGATVVRFVLACDDGQHVPVQLRARRLEGFVDEGDRVALEGDEPAAVRGPDGIARPARLRNLTTDSDVYTPGGRAALTGVHRSAAANVGRTAASTVVTLGVTGAVGAIASLGQSHDRESSSRGGGSGGGGGGGSSGGGTDTGLILFVGAVELVLLLALGYWLVGRRMRAQGRPWWPVAAGIVLAVAAANAAFAWL